MASTPTGFTVQNFRTALKTGGARPNLFEVILTFPAVANLAVAGTTFTLLCKAASIPGMDIAPIEVGFWGRKIKVSGDRTYPEWTLTVINDEDFALRSAFESWSNALNGVASNLRNPAAQFLNGYQVDSQVYQYGKIGNLAAEYKMVGLWPSNVQPMDLAWDNNDTIEEFQVTLQYQWWERVDTPTTDQTGL